MSYFGKSKMHTIDHYITDQDNNKKILSTNMWFWC